MSSDPVLGDFAYYTIGDALFYPGLIGLLDSLRLVGEQAPLYVVDCGFTEYQRATLARHVTLIPMRRGLHPVLQKATAPLAHPAEIMILIDADMLVTRPLAPLFQEAARGQLVAFEDAGHRERFFPEWSALGLGTPLRRPYVNCGLLIFSATTGSEFLPLFVELQERLDPADTHFGGADVANPLFFADQDVLNVIACTRFDGRMTRIAHRLAPVPPFEGLRVPDDDRFACAYEDGDVPYLLHHVRAKPWLAPMKPNAYSALLTRVVTSPAALVRLERADLPLRLRPGRLASLDKWRAGMQQDAHRLFRGRLGLRPAAERLVRRLRRNVRDQSV